MLRNETLISWWSRRQYGESSSIL